MVKMILKTRGMHEKRRDSALQGPDDDAYASDPHTYSEIHLEIPNECPIQPFPSPSPALLEFCSDRNIELLIPPPVDTPQRRESGTEQDADLVGLKRIRTAIWKANDATEDGEDQEGRDRLDRTVTTLWRPEAYEGGNELGEGLDRVETTIHVQPPTPEQTPESPDAFESTSQCATPRAQSFINLAALNTSRPPDSGPPSPVTSRYAPQRGGPQSPIAPLSPTISATTSATTSWTADLVDRTKQERITKRTPLPPTNAPLQPPPNKLLTEFADGTIPPNSTPRDPIATPIEGLQKAELRAIKDELAQALRQQGVDQDEETEDAPSSPEPYEVISTVPKSETSAKKATPAVPD